MRKLLAYTAGLAVALSLAPAAQASSLPRSDFEDKPMVGLSLGTGPAWSPEGAVSLDVPFAGSVLVGASAGTNMAGGITYDVRGMYRFVEGGRETPAIAGLVGIWGAPGMAGFQLPGSVAPFVGFGMAYDITSRFSARLNLAYSPFFNYGQETLVFIGGPPSSGVELGYKLTPTMQATLGIDGRGDLLGLSYTF